MGIVRLYPGHCSNQKVALDNGCTRQLWHEVHIWSTLSHPNIVPFLGVTYSRECAARPGRRCPLATPPRYVRSVREGADCEPAACLDSRPAASFPMPVCQYYAEGSLYEANKNRRPDEAHRSEALVLAWASGIASALA